MDVRAELDACGVHGRARDNAELVFEEVVSNVIRHAGDGHAHEIDVSLSCEANAIVLVFDDDGQPFNPISHPDPILAKSIEEAPPAGGFGIYLMRKAASGLHYERTPGGKNRLTVTIATT